MKLLLLCAAFLAVVSIVFCRGLPSEEEDRPGPGGSVKRYNIINATARQQKLLAH